MWLLIVCLHLLALSGTSADTQTDIDDVLRRAQAKVRAEDGMYYIRFSRGIDKEAKSFTSIDSSMFDEMPQGAAEIEKNSRLINWISFLIRKDRLDVTLQDVLSSDSSRGIVRCPFNSQITCEPSKYRSINGTCNNLDHPLRGSVFTPFARDLDPVYEPDRDGEDIDDHPRNSSLPGARAVSWAIHQNRSRQASSVTELSFFFTLWGQFLAHIITDKAVSSGSNSSIVDCCDQRRPSPQVECYNINVPPRDPFRRKGRHCLPLLRTMEATDVNCRTGRREQVNAATSYIDASAVYGSTEEKANFLRTHEGGELVMSFPNELPIESNGNKLAEKLGFAFLKAGDPRASENTALVGMHTLWVREHNRIARFLKLLNSRWTDEKVYQETRRIISAMIQHITYTEWLPILLGPNLMATYGLNSSAPHFFSGYDSSVDATTTNVLATAAFRFGHSLVSPTFPLCNRDYSAGSSTALTLKDLFLKPNVYLLNEQNVMRGLLVDRSQPMDPFVTDDLTNKLMETRPGNGGDLAAINIQRGRDHGLPGYNAWRESLGLSKASTFSRGFQDIPSGTVEALRRVYRHPDDVDVWTGGVSENPVSGGVVGPLFGNIIGRQFQRYKLGDRFWYETDESPQAFSRDQLSTIRNTTLARVICHHFDVDSIQPMAFKLSTAAGNQREPCRDRPLLRLLKWKE